MQHDNLDQGTGQLLTHGTRREPTLRRVFVTPGNPPEWVRRAFEHLGIELLLFRLGDGWIKFDDLSRFVRQWPERQ